MNSGPPSVVVQRAPDGWTHIGGPGMHLLIALDEEDDLTLTASDAADGGDLDDVIDVLTAGGMRRAHHFVGVHWVPTTRIVAFGPVAATMTFADGTEREVRGDSPRVWRNVDLDEAPERVELRVLDEQERTEPATSSSAQSVSPPAPTPDPSSAHSVSPETSSSVQNLRQSPPGAVPTFGPGPSHSPGSGARWGRSWARSPEASTSGELPDASPATSSVQEVRAGSAPAPGGGRDPLPSWGPGPAVAPRRAEPTASDLPVRTPAPPADVESTWTARPGRAEIDEPTSAAPIAPSTPDHDADGPAVPPSYDYLFGHTVTVDEHQRLLAGMRADSEPEPEPEPEPDLEPEAADVHPLGRPVSPAPAPPDAPGESTPSQPERPGTARPGTEPVRDSAASASGGGLISSVPWAKDAAGTVPAAGPAAQPFTEPSTGPAIQPQPRQDVPTFSGRRTPPPAPSLLPPVTPAPPSVDAGAPPISAGEPPVDADEQTVDRSALIEARRVAREGAPAGPSVLAVLCSAGHPTPPHADSCRLCGSPIPGQEPFTMARPPLGALRFSTGDVVSLDRSVLIGRAPKVVAEVAVTDRPHVVKVPSPQRDVSRNHVEVVLEGWHVLVRDLGTTNGTTVALPGEQPIRLRANDQQVLEPGSVVSLADEVSFTFDPGTA